MPRDCWAFGPPAPDVTRRKRQGYYVSIGVQDVGAPKRDPEKEPQCRDALVEGRNAGATRRQMQLIAAHVFEAGGIGRAAKEGGEVLDPLHVVMLSLRR